MSGLEVFDAAGQPMFVADDRLGCVVAVFQTHINQTGTVYVPEAVGADIFWLSFPAEEFVVNEISDMDETGGVVLENIGNGVIKWSYDFSIYGGAPPAGRPLITSHHVYLGVF
ncbi:hypothetical protein [Isoalcanivorax beigongshangi]|uniref:Uncharacterized protein n=1 Tax=Isoalcanivorax beigongshangi TaxID=3238810 RepID=A0ABV4AFE9_9GAMM